MHTLRWTLVIGLLAATLATAGAAERTKPAKPERIAYGAKVKLEDYLVPGKTVVFDFTSPFCGPCRLVAPYLDRLHESRDDIVVVAVDINRPAVKGIDWQSPVAEQYGIRLVPQFKIFTPEGKLQAEGEDAEKLVFAWSNFSWPEN